MMKTLRTTLSILALGLVAFSSVSAQQAVAQQPKPADSGPPLAVTMKFLEDKLNGLGRVNFVSFDYDTKDNSTSNVSLMLEYSKVLADKNQCRVSYHFKETSGQFGFEHDFSFLLRDVQDIVVKPYEQYETEKTAGAGSPNTITKSTSPSVMALVVHLPHPAENSFMFTNAELADRVAKALTHAVELCGGGNWLRPCSSSRKR